ncbi:hypothetical protein [Saccharicrinis aurantiacus]|uniref:hypothetical protein n=1 Tax=Saccharicrinis aurantiacus TaxID=1849719 RepID=UPI00094F9609|nr:hypothetical protein [Saccharicrinis aurantiacus]
MATIQLPRMENKGMFKRSQVRLLENFQLHYNAQQDYSRDKLKGEHLRVLSALVYYAYLTINDSTATLCQLDPKNAQMDSQEWVKVKLSKYLEANKIENKRHTDTIKRYMNRLVRAGAIVKSEEDFEAKNKVKTHRNEVLINPDLLLIYDGADDEYSPFTPFFTETDYQQVWNKKTTNCRGVSSKVPLLDSNKNEIMNVETVDKGVSPAVDGKQLNYSNKTKLDATPKQAENQHNSNSRRGKNSAKDEEMRSENPKDPNKGLARAAAVEIPEDVRYQAAQIKKREQKEDRLREVAVDLYCLMVQMLFKHHNIYQAEATMSIEYIAKMYLGTAQSEAELAEFARIFKWRISKAASYWNRHGYDTSNIYPMKYLNVSNKKGFAATKAWYYKDVSDRKRKAAIRQADIQKREEQQIIDKLMGIYEDSKQSFAVFNDHKHWLGQYYPHLLNAYLTQVIA